MSKTYTIYYRPYNGSQIKFADVVARNKEQAYYRGLDKVEEVEGETPYSVWVYAVTYNNGNYKRFNTFEGMPY